MASKENQLGAPAHGLGQQVSFAFQPTAPDRAAGGQRGGEVRGGVRGGGPRDSTAVHGQLNAGPPDPTASLILKMGEKYLAPKLAEIKQQKYMQGMSRAAAGEAVQEIAAEQPWYSQLFGDTDVVDGARAYATQAGVAKAVSAAEADMSELRKLPPAEATAKLNEQLKTGLTGDPNVDIHVMGATAKLLPGLLKRHAKEHYAYQQEQAVQAQSDSRLADADALQVAAAGLANGTIGAMEFDQRYGELPWRARPVPGQNPENYAKGLTNDLLLMARKGQLHAINAYRQGGALQALPAELAARVETAIDVAENRVRGEWRGKYAETIHGLKMRPFQRAEGDTPAKLFADITKLNTEYKALTGSTADLIPGAEANQDLEQMGRAIQTAEDKLNADRAGRLEKEVAARGKAAVDEVRLAQVDAFLQAGDVRSAKAVPHTSGEEVDARWIGTFKQLPPEQQGQFVANAWRQSGYVSPFLRDTWAAGLRGSLTGEATEGFRQSYGLYQQALKLDATGGLADAYFDQDQNHIKLAKFDVLTEGGKPELWQRGYNAAFVQPHLSKPDNLSAKERKDVLSRVVKDKSYWRPELIGGQPDVRPEAADALMAQLQKPYELLMGVPGMTADVAMSRAMDTVMRKGGRLVGGFFWQESPNQANMVDLVEKGAGPVAGWTQADKADAWAAVMRQALGKYADKPVALYRVPAGQGAEALAGYYFDPDTGKHVTIAITKDDLITAMKGQVAEARKPRTLGIKTENLQAGPFGGLRPAEGAPSIYASPEEWARYRQQQAGK